MTAVPLSTDERLPRALRVRAAHAARDRVDLVRKEALRPGLGVFSGMDIGIGIGTADVLAAVDRYEAVRDGFLSGTGTGYSPTPTRAGCGSEWPTR